MKKEEKLLNVYNGIVDSLLKNCLVEFTGEFASGMQPVSNVGTVFKIDIGILDDFTENIVSYRNTTNVSNSLFALLHEIGHCKTYSKKIDFNYKKWFNKYMKIKNHTKAEKVHDSLKWEKMADSYARNFINNNQELVKKWDFQINQILEEVE